MTNTGQYAVALICYEKATEYDSENIDALHGKALSENALNYSEDALVTYEKLVVLDPDNTDIHLELVETKLALKQYEDAKTYLENVMKTLSSEDFDNLYDRMNVDTPFADLASGRYDSYQLLKLSTSAEDTWVYYTTNGSEPTHESEHFQGDYLVISAPTTTIKAKCINSLGYESDTVEFKYSITMPVEEILKQSNSSTAKAIRKALNKSDTQVVYNYEAAQLTELIVVGNGTDENEKGVYFYFDSYKSMQSGNTGYTRGSSDMSLLKYTPYLETLVICWQNSVSLKNIPELQYLENLSLLNNQISNISDLRKCQNLKQLSLGWNRIEDISSIASLTQLETLGLWNNRITDITAIAEMKSLRYLDVANNRISTLEAVSGLDNLVEFWANGNSITSIAPLDPNGSLKVLMISNNPLTDFAEWKASHPGIKRCDYEG